MYGIDIDDNTLKCTSKEAFKYRVKLAIQEHAFNVLNETMKTMKTTTIMAEAVAVARIAKMAEIAKKLKE